MTKEELLSLVKAGFTKEDIISLSATKEFKTVVEAQPEEESKEVSVQAEGPIQEAPVVEETNTDDAFNKLNNAIESFTKKLESYNVLNAEMKQENKGDEGLEDILARVLLPDGKEVK